MSYSSLAVSALFSLVVLLTMHCKAACCTFHVWAIKKEGTTIWVATWDHFLIKVKAKVGYLHKRVTLKTRLSVLQSRKAVSWLSSAANSMAVQCWSRLAQYTLNLWVVRFLSAVAFCSNNLSN